MPKASDLPPSKAMQCRQNAYYCGMLASAAPTRSDRMQLLKMRSGWLALAESEEWLAAVRNPVDIAA